MSRTCMCIRPTRIRWRAPTAARAGDRLPPRARTCIRPTRIRWRAPERIGVHALRDQLQLVVTQHHHWKSVGNGREPSALVHTPKHELFPAHTYNLRNASFFRRTLTIYGMLLFFGAHSQSTECFFFSAHTHNLRTLLCACFNICFLGGPASTLMRTASILFFICKCKRHGHTHSRFTAFSWTGSPEAKGPIAPRSN